MIKNTITAKDNYQRFIMKNGVLYNKYGKRILPVQMWNNYLMMSSKKDGDNLRIYTLATGVKKM
jgi:hypothetical protein